MAQRFGELAVADITYVATSTGWAYRSLLMDASRMIVGYKLYSTLETAGPLAALGDAICFYQKHGVDIRSLIHHSDRGIQYCSNAYVDVLLSEKVQISMTQTGDPLHNAMAERLNNTIKNGWLFDCEGKSFEEVECLIHKAVRVYNNDRPHQALGMRTPRQALQETLLSGRAVKEPIGRRAGTA
ncbi:MAG: integrase core domain-containing protein [Prevotella sp.]|nr:integrase core domain-containing protein [Prevotella sp.]